MDDFEQTNNDLDSGLIDEIVCKGLSEYLFIKLFVYNRLEIRRIS